MKKKFYIFLLVFFIQNLVIGQRDTAKFERRINYFKGLSSYNSFKNDLNKIVISLQEEDNLPNLQTELKALSTHSKILSDYTLRIENKKFNFKFIQSLYKSLQLQEKQTNELLKNVQSELQKLKGLSDQLNDVVNGISTKNIKFYNSKDLIKDIQDEIMNIDSILNKQLDRFIKIETTLLKIQSNCYNQKDLIKEKLVFQNEKINESFDRKANQNVSLYDAIAETYAIKEPIVKYYLRYQIISFFWIGLFFCFGLSIYLRFKFRASKNNSDSNKSINIFNFLTLFSSSLFLFFNKSPLTIEEFIIVFSSLFLLISFIKIKSSKIKIYSWLMLTIAFVIQAFYSILIINFKYEIVTYLMIHLLFISAIIGLEFYYRTEKFKSKTRILIYIFLGIEIGSLVLFILNYVTLSQMITSGMIHSILTFILYRYCYKYIVDYLKNYEEYLTFKLPNYFENEIKNIIKLFKTATKILFAIFWLRILLHSFNLDIILINTIEYIINYTFTIKGQDISINWLLFVFTTLFITYLLTNLLTFYLDFYSNHYTKKNYGYKVFIKLGVYFISFYFILLISGFQIDKFTLILSALGFGIGFGLQNIAGNFTSGLLLMFEKKINIDDRIEINGVKGYVKDIGGRSVRIYCENGSDVLIPSSNFIENSVINWNLGDSKRRVEILLSFKPDTNIELLRKSIMEVLESDDAINQRNKTDVHVLTIDNKGIHVGVYFWFDNAKDEFAKISNLLENIKLALEKKDIQFYMDK